MKKIFLLLAIPAFMLSGVCIAQQQTDEAVKKEHFFYVSPVDLFFKTVQLGYESRLKNHNTIALIGGFKLSRRDEITDRIGGTGELQYRINLLYNKEAVSAIVKNYNTFAYFAPYFMYRYEEISDFTYTTENSQVKTFINSGFGGVGFGFRLSGAENRFTLDIFAGGGLKLSDINGLKTYSDFTEVGYTGIAPKAEFHMGIAF